MLSSLTPFLLTYLAWNHYNTTLSGDRAFRYSSWNCPPPHSRACQGPELVHGFQLIVSESCCYLLWCYCTILLLAFMYFLSVKFHQLFVEGEFFGLMKLIRQQYGLQTLCNRLHSSRTTYKETREYGLSRL